MAEMTPLDKLTLCEQLWRAVGKELKRNHYIVASNLMMLVRLGNRRVMVTQLMSEDIYMGTNCDHALKAMVDLGWLRREGDDSDLRRVYVSLTAAGKRVRADLLAIIDREVPRQLLGYGVDFVEPPEQSRAA